MTVHQSQEPAYRRLPASQALLDTSAAVEPTTVGSVLRGSAAQHPSSLAVVFGLPPATERATWTYAELRAGAEALARSLMARFDPGERLAIYAPNSPHWITVEFAAGLAGLVLVTVNPAFQAAELAYVLRQSRAAGIVYEPTFRGNPMERHLQEARADLPELREILPTEAIAALIASAPDTVALSEVQPHHAAQIQYTSGTTGFPKGACLHHLGITNNARLFAERLGVDHESVIVTAMPLFHTGGCVLGVLGAVQAGATLVQMELFDPALMLELIETYRATHLFGVPTMLIACMEQPEFATRDLSSLRIVCSGGATVPAELVQSIETRLGVSLCIVYGQTEASPAITLAFPGDSPTDKAETVGPPLAQVEVKIVDTGSGETTPVGVPGELCARGYQVMQAYFEMPEQTAEAIDADGWLHTGDLASMDERGYVTLTGRLKEMIIRGGENIYPREIEDVLFAHPKVAEVAVVGLPDPKWGEVVVAFVRDADPDDPASDSELVAHCRQHLAPHKTPQAWFRVAAFPLTPSGKIQKFALVEALQEGGVR